MGAHRVVVPRQTVLDGLGNGLVDFVPPGVDWAVQLTAVNVDKHIAEIPPIPTTQTYVNGMFYEGSNTGNNDSSDSRIVLNPGDDYQVKWTGGEPGATATCTLTVVQYAAGTAPPE